MSVKFVKYNGKKPWLCMGQLKVEIDGKSVTFGSQTRTNSQYGPFWRSGGCNVYDSHNDKMVSMTGAWEFDKDRIPNQYLEYADELIQLFKENVQVGCCGGCAKPDL